MSKQAAAMGISGLTRVTASTITISSYGVLSPSAAPSTGAAALGADHDAGAGDASNATATTIGVAVGVVLAAAALAAVAVVYRRFGAAASKDTTPAPRMSMVPASTFKSHDFDAEPDASPVVSPMAMSTPGARLSATVDVIPDARVSVTQRSSRRL